MRKLLPLVPMGLILILAAYAPAVPATENTENPPSLTATPGSMTADNLEAAHMMEPISALCAD